MLRLNSEQPTPQTVNELGQQACNFQFQQSNSCEEDLLSARSAQLRASRVFLSQNGYVVNTKSFYPYNSNTGADGRGSTFSSAIARVDRADDSVSQG